MKNLEKDKRLTPSQLSSIAYQLGECIINVRPQMWKTIFGRLIENMYFRLAMLSYIKNCYPEHTMKSDLLMLDCYEHNEE